MVMQIDRPESMPYIVAQPTHLLHIADLAWSQNVTHGRALESGCALLARAHGLDPGRQDRVQNRAAIAVGLVQLRAGSTAWTTTR